MSIPNPNPNIRDLETVDNYTWSSAKIADELNKIGSYTTASGTYTTAEWATGTNTCTWTAPEDGTYIVYMKYELATASDTNKKSYKQLQMKGTATRLLHDVLYYDDYASTSGFVTRTISQPVKAEKNQTIIPYIHTDTANIVYNIKILAIKI